MPTELKAPSTLKQLFENAAASRYLNSAGDSLFGGLMELVPFSDKPDAIRYRPYMACSPMRHTFTVPEIPKKKEPMQHLSWHGMALLMFIDASDVPNAVPKYTLSKRVRDAFGWSLLKTSRLLLTLTEAKLIETDTRPTVGQHLTAKGYAMMKLIYSNPVPTVKEGGFTDPRKKA